MKYSLTTGGLLFAVLGTVLLQVGFSEVCTNELVSFAPGLIGIVTAWYGRIRKGDVDVLGFRK